MTTIWLSFLERFASVSALLAVAVTIFQIQVNRSHYAALHNLGQCDAVLRDPQFSYPELGKPDLRDQTFTGERCQIERREQYLANLVCSLYAARRLASLQQWSAVAKTQISKHRQYFASVSFAEQNYFEHYSGRMRRVIQQQRAA